MTQPLIVSNIAPVIRGILDAFRDTQSNLKFVYDEALSYESALTKLRANNNMNSGSAETSVFPLLVFRRSALRHAQDGISRRAVSALPAKKVDVHSGTAELFNFMLGEFDLEFLYIVKTMEDLENFEIHYLSEEGLSKNKQIDVVFDGYENGERISDDPFNYFLKFSGEFLEKQVEDEGNYYKGIMGAVSVRGWYFLVKGTSPVITEINLTLGQNVDAIWSETAITPT